VPTIAAVAEVNVSKVTASTISLAASALANTRVLPDVAVTSVPTTCFTPLS
jgi:hypothetical protein